MIVMTFDEYDELIQQAESEPLPKDFKYPSIQTLERVLGTDDTKIKDILRIYCFPKDKQYQKDLNQLLLEMIYLTDDNPINKSVEKISQKNSKYTISTDELLMLAEEVKSLNFQCTYWYPSLDELQSHPLETNRKNIAFLLWLINCPSNLELTMDEAGAKSYAEKLLNENLEILS